jgi:uncharacterized membrane protein YgcG
MDTRKNDSLWDRNFLFVKKAVPFRITARKKKRGISGGTLGFPGGGGDFQGGGGETRGFSP